MTNRELIQRVSRGETLDTSNDYDLAQRIKLIERWPTIDDDLLSEVRQLQREKASLMAEVSRLREIVGEEKVTALVSS